MIIIIRGDILAKLSEKALKAVPHVQTRLYLFHSMMD